jgi:hypothetical protein
MMLLLHKDSEFLSEKVGIPMPLAQVGIGMPFYEVFGQKLGYKSKSGQTAPDMLTAVTASGREL